ncbi:hypothetical protein MN869_14235 [Acinetobacter sp. NIPH1876]|uniref:hypothetical protein n=1 Tax=Acinetobacter sp. NIPH1876 TaxID=2924041 RepID=UPI001FAB7DC3|nr:hypothetical protein [Acinetobacter sp. NIPH1876]MCJ0829604.1 hypothetical protein [Acinetobacter sp. NIPH1876]
MGTIHVFIGYDINETIAYHVCCESLIRHSSKPLAIHPLYSKALPTLASVQFPSNYPPSNQFIFSRFLVPYLMEYSGIALFLDGDMVINNDIVDLFSKFQSTDDWAVKVVKHDYKTSSSEKFKGATNLDYPRKNWSSVILWNCSHPSNRTLTPDYIDQTTGAFLHRFSWLNNQQIGELEKGWNVLADEENQEISPSKQYIYHYTLGTPCFSKYKNCQFSSYWHHYQKQVNSFIE